MGLIQLTVSKMEAQISFKERIHLKLKEENSISG